MKLEKKRSSSMAKIMNKLRTSQKKAEEMRSSMVTTQGHEVTRASRKALSSRPTRRMGSLSGCFTCPAFQSHEGTLHSVTWRFSCQVTSLSQCFDGSTFFQAETECSIHLCFWLVYSQVNGLYQDSWTVYIRLGSTSRLEALYSFVSASSIAMF